MHLQKEEKKFWKKHFRIEKLEAIPKAWGQLKRVDSQEDDAFFYFLSLRVDSILEIYLKDTLISDKAVQYMSQFKNLEQLFLRKHDKITPASIPYFNAMQSLKSLNVTRTQITLDDLCASLNNQSLTEVFLSDDETQDGLLEKGFLLKERMPKCTVFLNTSFRTDVFGGEIGGIY